MPRAGFAGLAHFINAVVLVGVSGFAWRTWRLLPDRVPMHFTFDGTANRWAEKGSEFGVLFLVPWLVVGLLYAIWFSLAYFRTRPQFMNLPPRLRDLPPERLAPFFSAMQGVILATATVVNLMLTSLLYGIVRVALGSTDRLPVWATWPWLIALGVVLLGGLARTFQVSRAL